MMTIYHDKGRGVPWILGKIHFKESDFSPMIPRL